MPVAPSPSATPTSNPESHGVILRGGPAELPEPARVLSVSDVDATLKLPLGNAYEHFRPTPETVERDGRRLRVFEWERRTYMAE